MLTKRQQNNKTPPPASQPLTPATQTQTSPPASMVKEETSERCRVYDKDGYKKRAACVCVRNEHENEVLLISSSRHANCWIIPGGGVETDENAEEAAEREVYEEAGVRGRLGRLLGIFESKERNHRTSVFVLTVDKELDDWEEHEKLGRRRQWFRLDEAKYELEKHKPVQSSYLSLLKGHADPAPPNTTTNGVKSGSSPSESVSAPLSSSLSSSSSLANGHLSHFVSNVNSANASAP